LPSWHPDETDATEYYYDVADFLPLLSYDHGNKAMLDQTINEITKLLEARHTEPPVGHVFHHPSEVPPDGGLHRPGTGTDPLAASGHRAAGQESVVRQTDAVLAEWLHTTRKTITTYKRSLHELGYLKIDTSVRPQRLSVRTFPSEVTQFTQCIHHLCTGIVATSRIPAIT
jgi:hypothetical protein